MSCSAKSGAASPSFSVPCEMFGLAPCRCCCSCRALLSAAWEIDVFKISAKANGRRNVFMGNARTVLLAVRLANVENHTRGVREVHAVHQLRAHAAPD